MEQGIRLDIAGGINTMASPDQIPENGGGWPYLDIPTFCRYSFYMTRTPEDIAGRRFGRLTAIRWESSGPTRWLCRCDCGNEKSINVEILKDGRAKSCGCLRKEINSARSFRHGYTASRRRGETNPKRIYSVWCAMLRRCRNPNCADYLNYGGRGISVCERWLDFANFLADMGEGKKGLSIDRINVDGNYEPGNCRWATSKEQCRNMRRNRYMTAFGKTQLRVEWEEQYGLGKADIDKMHGTLEELLVKRGR